MMDVNLSDYIAGGYFLVKPAQRTEWNSSELLPEMLMSLSGCICPVFDNFWGMTLGNPEKALEFGIPEHLFEDFRYYNDYDEGYPDTFARIETLRRFIAHFLPNLSDDTLLIGAGLHRERMNLHWTDEYIETYSVPGIGQTVKLKLPLASGGQPIGFDVAGEEYGIGCSWLCSSLEKEIHQLFGIRTDERGLLKTYAEAKQIADWINEGEGTRGEYQDYDPWLLVSYPLAIQS
jgi:hypothetical protein